MSISRGESTTMKSYNNIAVCIYGVSDDSRSEIEPLPPVDNATITIFTHVVGNDTGVFPMNFNVTRSSPTRNPRRHHLGDIVNHGPGITDAHLYQHTDHLRAMYLSILNKKNHEIENNQRFDLVMVRSLQGLRSTEMTSRIMLGKRNSVEWGGVIRSAVKKDVFGNGLWSINDSMFVGRSADIDTMSRVSLAYDDESLWKMVQTSNLDPAYQTASLGALLWKWAAIRNISIMGGLHA